MPVFRKSTPEALVANVVHLASLPSIYVRLEETLKDPDHTRNDIVDIIGIDPALCARILRVVNSSYYGLANPVHNIAIAVNLIGEYDLRNMVLVTSVVKSVASLVDDGIDICSFWRHSIRCGIAAKLLAKIKKHSDPELLFLSGLLHDLGQLIIYKNEPELSDTVSWKVTNEARERYQVEQDLLGFDHAIVGAQLGENWRLPAILNETIQYHHQPEHSKNYQIESKLVCFADQLAHFLELNNNTTNINIEAFPIIIINFLDDFEVQMDDLLVLLTAVMEQSQVIEGIICEV